MILLSASSFRAAAEDFTNAIHAYLQQRVELEKRDVGIVVGIVDEHGSSIVSCGKLDNGTDQAVNGSTVFEIGSVTKTFTALLLQDMIERGEMKLDDPVARYLPKSVRMPTRNGKEITLLQLATHTSGLPDNPDNVDTKSADSPYADYSVEKLYAFLSGYRLTRDPGAKYQYSNLGMGLLGHVIALKAGTNYESLVVDRICRPLKMDSTRITLTPGMKARFAQGHSELNYAVPVMEFGVLAGCGALCSTAHDQLKYVSANLGLTPSTLTPLMEKTQVAHFRLEPDTDIGLAWYISDLHGTQIIWKTGGTGGFRTFIGFDKARRRGVVVLANTEDWDVVYGLGLLLLESEWQSDHRPKETKISNKVYGSYLGQYQRPPDVALVSSNMIPSGIGICREGDRLFAQATGSRSWPVDVLLPPLTIELLPESENRFFERLSGIPMTFSRDTRGKVTGLTVHFQGREFYYEKISDQPPKAPEPLKRPVAIKLAPKLLDACVGHYEVAPDAAYPTGIKLTIWRQGDQLFGQAWGENVLEGAFDMYPESETNFFCKINHMRYTFIKNGQGEVTAVVRSITGLNHEGKKLK
jgi:CubicO group peptidase (beta-lactamase class C family)